MSRSRGSASWVIVILMGITTLFYGCGGQNPMQQTDTPTSGRIKVGIDESYRLLMEAEIYTFESLYKNAKIDTLYGTETDVFNAFLNDSIPLIVVNRKLTDQEEKYLNKGQFYPKTTRIAYDAVAFIVNRQNPDSNLYYEQIRDLFSGKTSLWTQINPKSRLGEIKVVFDNYKSSNPRYFKEKFSLEKLPDYCYAMNNNREVISFVENNPSAIGVVSVNWISDPEDSVSNNFLKRVTVAGISNKGNMESGGPFYQPYQGYIVQGDYPFTREVFCINRQTYVGLAYGLPSFIAGEKGQLILLHTGLVPATMPVRIVEVRN